MRMWLLVHAQDWLVYQFFTADLPMWWNNTRSDCQPGVKRIKYIHRIKYSEVFFLRCVWLSPEFCPCWERCLVQLGWTALGKLNQAHLECFDSLGHAGPEQRAPNTQLQIWRFCQIRPFQTAVGVKCVWRLYSNQVGRSGRWLSLWCIKPGLDRRIRKTVCAKTKQMNTRGTERVHINYTTSFR